MSARQPSHRPLAQRASVKPKAPSASSGKAASKVPGRAKGAPRLSADAGGRRTAAPSKSPRQAKPAAGNVAKARAKGGPSVSGKRRVAQSAAAKNPTSGASHRGIVRRGLSAMSRSRFVRLVAALALVAIAAFAAISAFSAQSSAPSAQRADGLPIYITDDMIDTARAMQREYGHPAGCTIAQIIQESGQGTHLSQLAERDNNLFGMKWSDSFAGKPGVVGPVSWETNEEYDGETVSITDAFIGFESRKACIEFRSSVFLQAATYANNPTIARAIETGNSALMAWGLQDAGWATDSSYAEHLIAVMDQYDLYRFDA